MRPGQIARRMTIRRPGAENLLDAPDFSSAQILPYQIVIFKPLSYCFEEIIDFDVKTSFASRPV